MFQLSLQWTSCIVHFSQTYWYHTTQNQILEHNTLGSSEHSQKTVSLPFSELRASSPPLFHLHPP